METGAITQYVDVAQLVLYVFWIFFFGLKNSTSLWQ